MKVLKAREGMWLTQSADVPDEERVFTDSVYLAVNDTEQRWREATRQERQEWDERMDRIIDEEEEEYEDGNQWDDIV